MKTFTFIILLFVLWFAPEARAEDKPPITARLVLKNKQTWTVQLLGRFHSDRILLRKEKERGTIELPIADIGRMDFKLPAGAGDLLDQYDIGDLDAAATGLDKLIEPYRDYITDASGNLVPLVQTLLKSWYHQGQHDKVRVLADHILGKTSQGWLRIDAVCTKSLSLLSQGKIDEAIKAAAELQKLTGAATQIPQVLYTQASLQMRRGQLDAAQETVAKLIAFQSRDLEWMPPALILSAEGYARAGSPEVAEQIVKEIALTFPGTRWVAQAELLDIQRLLPKSAE